MSRNRIAVVIGVLVVFVVVIGAVIYTTRGGGGKSVTFDWTVTGGKTMTSSPSDLTVHQNDTVTINVKSDTDGEVHLHLYDIIFNAKAGQTVSHTFKADKTGNCDIEWESTSTPLGKLVVSP